MRAYAVPVAVVVPVVLLYCAAIGTATDALLPDGTGTLVAFLLGAPAGVAGALVIMDWGYRR